MQSHQPTLLEESFTTTEKLRSALLFSVANVTRSLLPC